jgi:hypothetical protein
MKKASIFFANTKGDLHARSKAYLCAFKQRFFETPERALDRAYSAALMINFLEREYLQLRKAASSGNHSRDIEISWQANLKQLLVLIKLRLAEFKSSHLILGYPASNYTERMKLLDRHIEKLKLIDEVLDKHVSNQTSLSPLSLFQKQKTHSSNLADQQSLITVDVRATEVISNQRYNRSRSGAVRVDR